MHKFDFTTFFYVLFLTIWTFYLSKNVFHNWDMIAYLGVVEEYRGQDDTQVHSSVFTSLEESLSDWDYRRLTHGNYRAKVTADPAYFAEQLGFYRVKPLYTRTIQLFQDMGIDKVRAAHLPSILSFWIIGVLLFFWFRNEVGTFLAAILSGLLMLYEPMLNLAKFATPDALSTLGLLALCFACYYDKKAAWIYCLAVLSVLARIDNIIPVGLLLMLYHSNFSFTDKKELLTKANILLVIGVIGLFISISLLAGNKLSWFAEFTQLKSLKTYGTSWINAFHGFTQNSAIPVVIIAWIIGYRFLETRWRYLLWVAAGAILVRLLLYPSFQIRFFVWFELLVVLAISTGLLQKIKGQS